jgi:hypothetical protein
MKVFIIDIEASGLADESYPIEIGFCSLDQATTDSFLINPATAVNWDHWDEMSQMLYHQIPYEELNNGLSVQDAANRLNQALENKLVISDGIEWDRFWINKLFTTAGVERCFKLKPLSAITNQPQAIYEYIKGSFKFHRAAEDAKQIAEAILTVG